MLAFPAQIIWSTMPPGAAAPYLRRHSELVQMGMDTSCKTEGWGPPRRMQRLVNFLLFLFMRFSDPENGI